MIGAGVRGARWFGLWGLAALIGTIVGLVVWWNANRSLALPVPPQAQQVSSQIISGVAKTTTLIVPTSVDDVRAFYRQALPEQGWNYCGTQATPDCTNLVNLAGGQGAETDVYRRADDQEMSGTTIEIWPAQNARGETQVVVWETTAFR